MTSPELELLKNFVRWLTDTPERVKRLRELSNGAAAATHARLTNPDGTPLHPEASHVACDEAAAKVSRQYLCSLAEAWDGIRPGSSPTP